MTENLLVELYYTSTLGYLHYESAFPTRTTFHFEVLNFVWPRSKSVKTLNILFMSTVQRNKT